jgi:hypothetical protein
MGRVFHGAKTEMFSGPILIAYNATDYVPLLIYRVTSWQELLLSCFIDEYQLIVVRSGPAAEG